MTPPKERTVLNFSKTQYATQIWHHPDLQIINKMYMIEFWTNQVQSTSKKEGAEAFKKNLERTGGFVKKIYDTSSEDKYALLVAGTAGALVAMSPRQSGGFLSGYSWHEIWMWLREDYEGNPCAAGDDDQGGPKPEEWHSVTDYLGLHRYEFGGSGGNQPANRDSRPQRVNQRPNSAPLPVMPDLLGGASCTSSSLTIIPAVWLPKKLR